MLTSVVDPNTPTNVTNSVVAPGVANVTAAASVTYTDSKTNQPTTVIKSVIVPYTVAAIVSGENTELRLIQGTPQTVPTTTTA